MKHPAELATAIEEARRQACRAYDINDKSLKRSRQHCVRGALLQQALDIADGTIILVEKGFPGPALALARPLIESWVRGVWASKGADDQEIDDFVISGRPDPWRLEELAEYVKDRIPTETEWLEETIGRREVMSMLNNLTHGGRWQVQYRVGDRLCLRIGGYWERRREPIPGFGSEESRRGSIAPSGVPALVNFADRKPSPPAGEGGTLSVRAHRSGSHPL